MTRDADLIAGLCKPVQELHEKLYPRYFKPFVSEEVQSWLQKVIDSDENSFFFVIVEEREMVGLRMDSESDSSRESIQK